MKRDHKGEGVQQGIDKATGIPHKQLFMPQVNKDGEQVTPLVVTSQTMFHSICWRKGECTPCTFDRPSIGYQAS